MVFYIIIILCFLAFLLFQKPTRKPKIPSDLKEIPIEKGLPIIGIVRSAETSFCNYLVKLSEKHGSIFRIKYGMRDIVVLNSFKLIRSALVENGDALSGRWKSQKYLILASDVGLSFVDGYLWAEQRSFVLKTLKDFGIGKSRSIKIVQEECFHLIDDLEQLKGKSVNFAKLIPVYTANVISKFIMNKRFSQGDPEFEIFEKSNAITLTQNDVVANLSLMFPFIENNERLMKFLLWVTSRKSLLEDTHDILNKEIKEHLEKLDFNSEGDDFMDRFLIKQHQLKEKNGSVKTFSNYQLVIDSLELFSAGSGTAASTFVWSFMFMSKYPDVQIKVYQEIVDKIGNERMPTMSDKVSFNFTQAVMDEIVRLSSVAPLALFHRTLNDVSLNGYFIPKDTVVIPNIFASNLDPNIWEKPYEFNPAHFLSRSTNGELKYKPREELIPFSMGKRQCLGESLARIELFIFFTTIIQRFQVNAVNMDSGFDIFHANHGVLRTPDIQDFTFTAR